jgi:hypothetical protein
MRWVIVSTARKLDIFYNELMYGSRDIGGKARRKETKT